MSTEQVVIQKMTQYEKMNELMNEMSAELVMIKTTYDNMKQKHKNMSKLLAKMEAKYQHEQVNTIDGVKIDFDHGWVHLRKSNTEPIIRVYAESNSEENAEKLANQIIVDIKKIAE